MARPLNSMLFYDFDAAKAFGEEVDYIANETMVATGSSGTLKSIFGTDIISPSSEVVGEYHVIKKDVGSHNQDSYYVRYGIYDPPGALKADVELAKREAKEYLEQKYQELGPDTGVSRA